MFGGVIYMKKIFASLLICMMLAMPAMAQSLNWYETPAVQEAAAPGQLSGNLANDGFICTDGESLFFACDGALWRMNQDGTGRTRVAQGDFSNLHFAQGCIYAVSSLPAGAPDYEVTAQTLVRIDLAGNIQTIGDTKAYGSDYTYGESGVGYSHYDFYTGYGCFTIAGDQIYYIANNGRAGSYVTIGNEWFEGTLTTTYESNTSLYRMNLDGTGIVELVRDLGNGRPFMAMDGDKIYIASSYQNPSWYTNFITLGTYDLNGGALSMYSMPQEYYAGLPSSNIALCQLPISSIQASNGELYFSIYYSEGDFRDNTFHSAQGDLLAYEAYTTPAIAHGDKIYFMGSESQTPFRETDSGDKYGLYTKAIGEEGVGTPVFLLNNYARLCNVRISIVNDAVYVLVADEYHAADLTQADLYRVDLNGENPQVLTDEGFCAYSDDAAYTETEEGGEVSAYIIPDSDSRLLTREELSGYSLEELGFIRNEILARHGYPFKKEKYLNYFSAQPWYVYDENFDYNSLSSIEMENVELIKRMEAELS